MSNSSWSLNDLTINTQDNIQIPRSLTREQILVLGWFVFNQESRSYSKMARDCSLSLDQCETTVEQLMNLDIIRFR